jgi:2-phosphoglycerate kinase
MRTTQEKMVALLYELLGMYEEMASGVILEFGSASGLTTKKLAQEIENYRAQIQALAESADHATH